MAVEDEVILEFQGEDTSLSSTTKSVIQEITDLQQAINNLTSTFNNFSQSSSNIANEFKNIDITSQDAANSMREFVDSGSNVNNVNRSLEEIKQENEELRHKIEENEEATRSWADTVRGLQSDFKTVVGLVGGIYNRIKKYTLQAAEATRVQTKFAAVFDKQTGEYKEAKQWAEDYANALYLDEMQVQSALAKFRVFTSTMGVSNDKSKEMSYNMTQLAYDLAAVSGNDVTRTMSQITAALGGQTKALKEYGISIDKQTLKQTLYSHGIDKTVSSLTAAQLAETRYVQIMESTAGMQGYYAKTLLTPANALNIIKTQFSILAREIGNVFIPILMALVPVVIAVTKALRNLAQMLANFLGIKIDFSDVADGFEMVGGGIDDVGNSADGTSKKIKNMLRDFDDLHVVDFGQDTGGGSGSGIGAGGGGGSLFDAQEYADWSGYLDEITDKFKQWLPLIAAIGAAFAAWKLAKIVDGIKTFLKVLDNHPFIMLAASLVSLWSGISLFHDAIRDAMEGTFGLDSAVKLASGAVLTFIGTLGLLKVAAKFNIMGLGALGLPALAKLAGSITLIILGLIVAIDALVTIMDKGREASSLWLVVLGGLSLAMIGLTTLGAPLLAVVMGIAYGVMWFAGLCVELKTRIENLFDPTVEIVDAFDWMSEKMKKFGDQISGTTDDMTKDFTNMSKGVTDNLNLIDAGTSLTADNIDKYLTDDMKTTLGMSEKDWQTYKKYLIDTQKDLDKNTKNEFDSIDKTVDDTGKNFGDTTEDINSSLRDLYKNTHDTATGMSQDMKKSTDDIKGFFNFEWKLPDIKLPHFDFQWETDTLVGKAFQKLGFQGKPVLKVDWYAQGGFPNKGDLFIANEREPELIGSMGNKSAVANSGQIIEGIAQGSYAAFKKALNDMQGDFGGDTVVYVGDTQITDVITKRKRIQDRRFGR